MDQSPNLDMDNTMDKVVKHIYNSCDVDNTNSVPVALLIDYVKPYMPENLSELEDLKLQLDPNGTNPCVSSEVFSQAMNVWTTKLKERDSEDSFHAIEDPNNLPPLNDNENLPFGMSTPRPSIGYSQLLKNCSEILNLSNVSTYGTSENTVAQDKSQYEEQIKELQHLTQKTTHELDLLKQQLSAAEEQNEQLILDLEKTTKLLQVEQQLTKQLKEEKVDTEELKEEIKSLQSKNMRLENKLRRVEIEKQSLLQESLDIENKKTQIEYKLETTLQKEIELKKKVTELKEMIDIKETEISTLIKVTETLKYEMEEKEELLTFYTKENERFKTRTFNLEKCLEEKYSDLTFDKNNLEKSASLDSLHYNSPKLLGQVANPVSPCFGSPILPVIAANAGDGVKLQTRNEVPLLRIVLTRTTSTPNENRQILDESLPTEMKSCPTLLSPITGENQSNKAESGNSTNIADSPPILYVVDRSDSPRRSISHQKSLQDELSEVAMLRNEFNDEHQSLQDEVNRLNDELQDQEEIKNLLWKNAKQAEKEAEFLKSYKEDYEKLVYDLEEKREVVSQLQQNLDVSTFNLEEEKRLNSELRRELEMEIIKNRTQNKQLNEFLVKTFDHKFSQTDDNDSGQNLHKLLKEIDLLNSKYMELKNQNKFLSQTKESLEKLWLDNQIATKDAENIVSSIFDKVEKVSTNFIAFNKKGSELQNQLPVLEKMIDMLLLNVKKLNTTGSSLDRESPKMTNYGKQQLRIDRMKDKLENLEKEISFERNLRIQANDENVRNKNDISKLNCTLQQYKDINEKMSTEIKNLKREALDYEEDLRVLRREKEYLNTKFMKVSDDLRQESQENQNLMLEQHRLKAELDQAKSDELKVKNELNVLQKSFDEKEKQFSVLENAITSFISDRLKEFQTAISNISGRLEGNPNAIICFQEANLDLHKNLRTNLDENLYELNSNMQFALFLLETVTENYLDLIANENIARQRSLDSENLVSPSGCDVSFDFENNNSSSLNSDESFCSFMNDSQNCARDAPFQECSFLENLEIQSVDGRSLSKRELEEKFTALALSFTVDSTTSRSRYEKQKDKFDHLLKKHFNYLEYILDLLKKCEIESDKIRSALSIIEHLKYTARDVFESAQQYGLVQYEIKTVNCWNLVTNYVALLSRENKEIKQEFVGKDDCQEIISPAGQFPCRFLPCFSMKCVKRVFLSFVTFIFVLIVVVLAFVYVQWKCSQFGRTRVCPFEWAAEFLIKRVFLRPPTY